jgi:hypothetical protein
MIDELMHEILKTLQANASGCLARPSPWGTFTSCSLPAFLAHSDVGQIGDPTGRDACPVCTKHLNRIRRSSKSEGDSVFRRSRVLQLTFRWY